MTIDSKVIEAVYNEGKVETQDKPFSACKMTFSPHGGDDWVFGATEDVQSYWDSLTCSFDFNWYLFNSASEMLEYLEESQNSNGFATYFNVKDCRLGEAPLSANKVIFFE